MTRFWISTTELFVIMNSFTITEGNKNQWIYQWMCCVQIIWKLSYINLLRIIVWTLNYVDCIFGLPAVAGRVLWIRVCPSFHPAVLLSGGFLGIGWLVFSETQPGVRGPYIVVHGRARLLQKNLAQKMGKMGKKWGKNRFFSNLLENLVINFFWIWSIMKVYTICCILARIPCLGKIWFLRYGPKCSRPIRLQDF